MTEKKILFINFFLSLNISDFSLFFFCRNCNPRPLKKVIPSFPATPSQSCRLRSCQAPLFWKFGRRFNPIPPARKRGCTLCIACITFVFDTYSLENWNEENQRMKTSNWIVDYFSLTFVNFLLTWIRQRQLNYLLYRLDRS